MYVVKAAETMFVRKICVFNVDEIDTRVVTVVEDVEQVFHYSDHLFLRNCSVAIDVEYPEDLKIMIHF